jgi:hypothetical protein
LDELIPVWKEFTSKGVARRTGQALEIAVFKALVASERCAVYGGFGDLHSHGDDQLYSKEEVKNFNGRTLGNRALDFIASVDGFHCGIETKNVRHWYYAHDPDLREMIQKSLVLRVVPVLIARRIQYVTFRVLGTCGVVMHETYNQRMAKSDEDLADRAKRKDLLGYHDIQVNNEPDARLAKFMDETLPSVLPRAIERLQEYQDLLEPFASGEMAYAEFAARVRRREQGANEDHDWPDEDPYDVPGL